MAETSSPSVATVHRTPESAVRSAAGEVPEVSSHLPDGGEQHAGVVRVYCEVCRAGVLALVQDVFPVLAAVNGPEHAALEVRAEGVTERADVNDVGVGRVNPDAGDVAGVLESEVLPGSSSVVGPVHAISVADVEADARLAHASVHDRRVGVRHGDRTDGGGVEVAVRDVFPVGAAVVCLPHAARTGSEVEGALVNGVARNGDDAAASRGSDAAPLKGVEHLGVYGVWGALVGGHGGTSE